MLKPRRLIIAVLFGCCLSLTSNGSPELGIEEPEYAVPVGPVIEVYGNGYLIDNGSSAPRDYNLTNFGFEYVDERHTHWFTIENNGDEDLILDGPLYVSLAGHERKHFSVRSQPADVIAPGGSTVFAIAYEPDYYGEVEATVMIYSNDGSNSPYTFIIRGGDDDDDHVYWYARCGMVQSDAGGYWLLLVVIGGLTLLRYRTRSPQAKPGAVTSTDV